MQFDPVFLSRSEPAIVTSLSRTSAKPLSLQRTSRQVNIADPDPATIPNSVGPLATMNASRRRHDPSIILSEWN